VTKKLVIVAEVPDGAEDLTLAQLKRDLLILRVKQAAHKMIKECQDILENPENYLDKLEEEER